MTKFRKDYNELAIQILQPNSNTKYIWEFGQCSLY